MGIWDLIQTAALYLVSGIETCHCESKIYWRLSSLPAAMKQILGRWIVVNSSWFDLMCVTWESLGSERIEELCVEPQIIQTVFKTEHLGLSRKQITDNSLSSHWDWVDIIISPSPGFHWTVWSSLESGLRKDFNSAGFYLFVHTQYTSNVHVLLNISAFVSRKCINGK